MQMALPKSEAGGVQLTRACPQCGSNDAHTMPEYSVQPWRIVQCEGCEFVYLQNVPVYERLVDELAWEKTSEAERERRRVSYPVVNRIEHLTRWRLFLIPNKAVRRMRRMFKEGRILDVGCAAGRSVPEPFIPFGVEISKELATAANELMSARGGYAICAPAVEGVRQFPDRYFSGVVLSSFLEHEANPKQLLEQVARVVADDGKVYVRVPNFSSINRRVMQAKWCGFRHPDHVNYFTPRSLRRMAKDCGFKMRVMTPLSLPFNDNINAILSRA